MQLKKRIKLLWLKYSLGYAMDQASNLPAGHETALDEGIVDLIAQIEELEQQLKKGDHAAT